MIRVGEIERMTEDERLQTMEWLCTSLTRTPDDVASPDWHGEVLAGRLPKIKRGEGEFLTLAEAKARLQKPTAMRRGAPIAEAVEDLEEAWTSYEEQRY